MNPASLKFPVKTKRKGPITGSMENPTPLGHTNLIACWQRRQLEALPGWIFPHYHPGSLNLRSVELAPTVQIMLIMRK